MESSDKEKKKDDISTFLGEPPKPPSAHTRSIYIPADKVETLRKAEKIGETLGVNINVALMQGLQYWIERNEITYLRKMKEDSLKLLRSLEGDLKMLDEKPAEAEKIKVRIEKGRNFIKRIETDIWRFEDTTGENLKRMSNTLINTLISYIPEELVDAILESDLKEHIIDRVASEMEEEAEIDSGDYPPEYYTS